jgi:hypothetical protein
MTKRRKVSQQELLAKQSRPVPMAVVCSLVYNQLNHDIGNIGVDRGYVTAMNSTALALSQVADIYYVAQGRLLRIPSEELASGSFEESGAVYRSSSGREFRSLSMRRIDVMEAMKILKRARAAIETAKVRARNH